MSADIIRNRRLQSASIKILLAITTCGEWKFQARANAQRETWIPAVQAFADVKFFLAEQDRDPLPDEVFLDVNDDYLALPQKVQCAVQWGWENNYDKMVKLDDDAFAFADRLFSEVPKQDYVGQINGTPPFCSGFCYWLSRKAMEHVAFADLPDDPTIGEDRFVGSVLRANGILPMSDPQIYSANCTPRTAAVNSLTKACAEFNETEMKQLVEGPKLWLERSRIAAEKARRNAKIMRGDGTPLFGK